MAKTATPTFPTESKHRWLLLYNTVAQHLRSASGKYTLLGGDAFVQGDNETACEDYFDAGNAARRLLHDFELETYKKLDPATVFDAGFEMAIAIMAVIGERPLEPNVTALKKVACVFQERLDYFKESAENDAQLAI